MSIIESQIQKAIQRAAGLDLDGLIASIKDRPPKDFVSEEQKHRRCRFLTAALGDGELANDALERVLDGNELQPASYLARGDLATRSVARIEIRNPSGAHLGWGTGFLIAPSVLITNNHVFGNESAAIASEAHFHYETDLDDNPLGPIRFAFAPKKLFFTSLPMDFSIVAVEGRSLDGGSFLSEFGFLPLLEMSGKALEGEWLTIVQHPSGERKQLCVRENRLIKRADDVLWYSTDTLPGSSGSPVFDNDWYVVALHHSGVPEKRNGVTQTLDGRDFNPATMDERDIKWIANEGIRASRITQTLKAALPNHPMLQPLFTATPASARIGEAQRAGASTKTFTTKIPAKKEATIMSNTQTITVPVEVTFNIDSNGAIYPVNTSVGQAARESALFAAERASSAKPAAKFDAPFDPDYSKRNGYNPKFLGDGNKQVNLPKLTEALVAEVVPLLKSPPEAVPLIKSSKDYLLHYNNYTVVMHAKRKFAIYSAANLRFGDRYDMSRPTDVWRIDPRIKVEYQIQNWYYANNKFDRGHLTRREDLEYGKTVKEALQSAGDTCHWTNCTPQHAKFNQNKEIWQGIERYILETTILEGSLNAQVITGPVLDAGDPEYKGVQYPLQYWKVVAALDSNNEMFATAYIASQDEVIAQFGIEAAVEPFGPYKHYQVKIAEIERLTGLQFTYGTDAKSLSERDPLTRATAPRRPRRRQGGLEAALPIQMSGYYPIQDLDDIVL